MDRDAIERRDFPTGRRGYDPAAVDAHLRRVADEMEALAGRPAAPAGRPTLSAGTSEQVRLILEAAERSAQQLRDQAGAEAGEHVARVHEAAESMLGRLDGLEQELGRLLEALRASGERLTQGLAELQAQTGALRPPAEEEPPPAHEPPAASNGTPELPSPEPLGEEDYAAAAPADPAPDAGAADDEAGARLTALNMALSGTPREETARYLAEHFTLADPEGLLDDVYARAGG